MRASAACAGGTESTTSASLTKLYMPLFSLGPATASRIQARPGATFTDMPGVVFCDRARSPASTTPSVPTIEDVTRRSVCAGYSPACSQAGGFTTAINFSQSLGLQGYSNTV